MASATSFLVSWIEHSDPGTVNDVKCTHAYTALRKIHLVFAIAIVLPFKWTFLVSVVDDTSGDDCSELVQADGSCADSCCKTHDKCCGSLNREVCNDIIISCLERCESGQYDKCKHPGTGVPVHPKVILYAMKLNPNGCCGTRCGKLGANKTRDQLFDEFQKAMQDDA